MELPSLSQRAVHLAVAVGNHILDGMKRVTLEEYKGRIFICNGCPKGWMKDGLCYNPKCGCVISIKAWWNSEKCPEDFW
jgi:hypothetical protein